MPEEDAEGTLSGRLKKPIQIMPINIACSEYSSKFLDMMRAEMLKVTGISEVMLISYDDKGELQVKHVDPFKTIQGHEVDFSVFDEVTPYSLDYADIEMRALAHVSQDILNEQMAKTYDLSPLVLGGAAHGGKSMTQYELQADLYGDLIDKQVTLKKELQLDRQYKKIRKPLSRQEKQNGKSADYLDLDPTKNHRKRRR